MGFTRKELAVLLFLAVSFLSGLGVWLYRARFAPLPESGPFLDIEGTYSTQGDGRPSQSEELKEGQSSSAVPANKKLVDLNRSQQGQIETLPGVGPVIAGRIIEFRTRQGDFQTIDELLKVKGIGIKTLDRIRPYLKPIQKQEQNKD